MLAEEESMGNQGLRMQQKELSLRPNETLWEKLAGAIQKEVVSLLSVLLRNHARAEDAVSAEDGRDV